MANVFDLFNPAKHRIAWTTKVGASHYYGHAVNVKTGKDLDNGALISLGKYVQGEVYEAVPPIAGAPVYMIVSSEVGYSQERSYSRDECYNYCAKGETVRALQLNPDDFITISANGFATSRTPAKDDYVTYSYATDLYTATTTKPSTGFIGQITDVISQADGYHYEIKVVAPSVGTNIDATYGVTMTLTNLTSDAPNYAFHGQKLIITLEGTGGKTVPDALTSITMGGSALSDYTYADGVITIASVTGAIVITATGKTAG